MREIYLGRKKENRIIMPKITIDPVPPKSTYRDSNRSNWTGSKTFRMPSEESLQRLFKASEKIFDDEETKNEEDKIMTKEEIITNIALLIDNRYHCGEGCGSWHKCETCYNRTGCWAYETAKKIYEKFIAEYHGNHK